MRVVLNAPPPAGPPAPRSRPSSAGPTARSRVPVAGPSSASSSSLVARSSSPLPAPKSPALVSMLEPKGKGTVLVLWSNEKLERAEINKSQTIQELRRQVNLRNIGDFKRIFMRLSCGTGTCPKDDFVEALVQFGVRDRQLCYRLFKLFDSNGSGDIDFKEFELGIARTMCEPLDRVLYEFFNDRGWSAKISWADVYRMFLEGAVRRVKHSRAELEAVLLSGQTKAEQSASAANPLATARPQSLARMATQRALKAKDGPIKQRSPLAKFRVRAAFWSAFVVQACGDRTGRVDRSSLVTRAVGDRVLRFIFRHGMGWVVDGQQGQGTIKIGAMEDEEDKTVFPFRREESPSPGGPIPIRRPISIRKSHGSSLGRSLSMPVPPMHHSTRSGGVPLVTLAAVDPPSPLPPLRSASPLPSASAPSTPAATMRSANLSTASSLSSSFSSPGLQSVFSDYSIAGADPRRLQRQRRPL